MFDAICLMAGFKETGSLERLSIANQENLSL